MRFDISALTLATIVVPVLAAKTWDVNIVNGSFSPAIIDIALGDTVRWPNTDGPDHAFVQTEPGYRSCTPLSGGFNSGRKTVGQSYQRTFQSEAVVNYKDGIGANCAKLNSTGTIYVGPRLADAPIETTSAAGGVATTTVSGSTSATGTATTTTGTASTSTGVTTTLTSTHTTSATPTETQKSAGNSLLAQGSFALGFAALVGALVAF
ncbi:hypothetical protein BGX26_010340 [Mortierella sp. AD094]|nr:hypothetical protein BGX26_010340 [Mortierella sp. AD094]